MTSPSSSGTSPTVSKGTKTKREAKLTNFFASKTVKKLKADDQSVQKNTQNSNEVLEHKIPANSESAASKVLESEKEQAILESFDKDSLVYRTMGHDWLIHLSKEVKKPYFNEIIKFVNNELSNSKRIYPPIDEIFSWSVFTKFENVKIVILGQDPYFNPGQAHGLAFSVKKGVPPPPSLKNIYAAIKNSYPGAFSSSTGSNKNNAALLKSGFLKGWADQGVLMLNSTLTVEEKKPNSHKDVGWETFTDAVISLLNTKSTNLVFLLWGSFAQKKADKIIDPKKHLVLKSVHPSPLSAHRGFLQCNHFKLANDYLAKHNKATIDWEGL
ncbi:Uracil-DNA glycosylase [Smittium culicis]|uniref:Uracil-DNA glycosylase n=1 Tax=Smittium culicis TaxID=133412 RepID=A0A1R1XK20_9FUNG|nr:Uracil-DNA glycosylase [Smittium culicis]